MVEESNYWARLQRTRLSRRAVLRGSAAGAAGLAAASVFGCGDDSGAPGATSGGQQPSGAATLAPTSGAGEWVLPPPPSYSNLSAQKLLQDYNFKKVGPQIQVLGTPKRGGVLVVAGLTSENYHPGDPKLGTWGQWPFGFSHSNLVGQDWDYKKSVDFRPPTTKYAVSESWEQPDSTTYVFKLRSGVTFHPIAPANGAELTVDDIKATYEWFKTQRFPSLHFKTITSMTEPTKGTLRITTSEPAVQLLGALRSPSYGILNRKHIEEGEQALNDKAIGTGPFMAYKMKPGVARIQKRNPNWWWPKDQWGNQLPYLDGIVHKVHKDTSAILASMRTNQIDYFRPTGPEEFERMRKELDTWGQVSIGTCASCSPIMAVSHRDPLFKDVRIRRALSLAVNRQDILDTMYGGAGNHKHWINYYWRGLAWPEKFEEMGEWYKYDPERAKTLLREAGVQAGTKVQIMYQGAAVAGGGAGGGQVATIDFIMRDLKAIGIELQLKPVESFELNRTAYDGKWTGLMIIGENAPGLDPDSAVKNAVTDSGTNPGGINDTRVDELWRRQRAEVNPEARQKILQELETYVNRDQLLRGVQLPDPFGYGQWHKYMHNVIESSVGWFNGGDQTWAPEWWGEMPSRDLESF